MEKGEIVKFEDGKILIKFDLKKEIDPNKDGEALAGIDLSLTAWVDLMELPSEAIDLWKKKKG